jgi:methanogenic corrinoid protein MtbC1
MIGGAPVCDDYRKEIGADFYAPDAARAAEIAIEYCKKIKTRSNCNDDP